MNRHITLLLATVVLLLLGSCSSATDEPDVPTESKYTMGIYVNLGGVESPRKVRAVLPDGPGYESGVGFENYIDINDIQVYLFTTDNKLITPLTGDDMAEKTEFIILPKGESDKYNTASYRILFRVDKVLEDVETKLQSFKVVFFANWGVNIPSESLKPGETTIDDLTKSAQCIGEYKSGLLSEENRMPFYGVQEYVNVQFEADMVTSHREQLVLLRALAKIDVYDHEQSLDKIESVRLTRYNTHFYKAPLGIFHNDQYTNYGYDYDFVPTLSLPAENPFLWESTDMELPLIKDEDGHFIVYVPEYQNTGRDASQRATLLIRYSDGQEITAEFKYYSNPPEGSKVNDPYDIRRNYWYKYRVNRKESDIILSADVLPYKEIILNPEFGLDEPKKPEEPKEE